MQNGASANTCLRPFLFSRVLDICTSVAYFESFSIHLDLLNISYQEHFIPERTPGGALLNHITVCKAAEGKVPERGQITNQDQEPSDWLTVRGQRSSGTNQSDACSLAKVPVWGKRAIDLKQAPLVSALVRIREQDREDDLGFKATGEVTEETVNAMLTLIFADDSVFCHNHIKRLIPKWKMSYDSIF